MILQFKYDNVGGFYHVDMFAGTGETLGKVGELIFRDEEWESFKYLLETGAEVQNLNQPYIQLVIEEKPDV